MVLKDIITIKEHIIRLKSSVPPHVRNEGIENNIIVIEKELNKIKDYIKPIYTLNNHIDINTITKITQKLESFKSFNFNIKNIFEDTIKLKAEIFEVEGGKIAILNDTNTVIAQPNIYFDQKFLDSNLLKSTNSIKKYNL